MESTQKPSPKEVSKKGVILGHAILTALFSLAFLFAPIYEATVDGKTSYTFFWNTFPTLKNPNNIFFLVITLLGAIGGVVGAIFFLLSYIRLAQDKEDTADKCFMIGGISFVACMALIGLQGLGLSLVIVLVSSLTLAVLGFVSLYLYFKKLAMLADD